MTTKHRSTETIHSCIGAMPSATPPKQADLCKLRSTTQAVIHPGTSVTLTPVVAAAADMRAVRYSTV